MKKGRDAAVTAVVLARSLAVRPCKAQWVLVFLPRCRCCCWCFCYCRCRRCCYSGVARVAAGTAAARWYSLVRGTLRHLELGLEIPAIRWILRRPLQTHDPTGPCVPAESSGLIGAAKTITGGKNNDGTFFQESAYEEHFMPVLAAVTIAAMPAMPSSVPLST